jgi:hypothetical protein
MARPSRPKCANRPTGAIERGRLDQKMLVAGNTEGGNPLLARRANVKKSGKEKKGTPGDVNCHVSPRLASSSVSGEEGI